ncbi:hypothetical protein BGZ99_010182 [Dissophora globulifera]|uniref:Uncharacterized protein n=1 Tax=Dissophora globulifera TaxID=979702 RepID=A0A9P6UL97_9FUNG|nr:hypothetical protein BGZ99_010182 [Dissophora globulifera]
MTTRSWRGTSMPLKGDAYMYLLNRSRGTVSGPWSVKSHADEHVGENPKKDENFKNGFRSKGCNDDSDGDIDDERWPKEDEASTDGNNFQYNPGEEQQWQDKEGDWDPTKDKALACSVTESYSTLELIIREEQHEMLKRLLSEVCQKRNCNNHVHHKEDRATQSSKLIKRGRDEDDERNDRVEDTSGVGSRKKTKVTATYITVARTKAI